MLYRSLPVLFFSVVMVAAVSGCTSLDFAGGYNSNTPEGAGVIIESFQSSFSEVFSGEEVIFTVKVRNSGSFRAENGFAEILGLDQTWKPVNEELMLEGELLPNEEECRYPLHSISLLPPDPSSGIRGSDKICTWSYRAPRVQKGLSADYEPRVRFFYDYKSYAVRTVTLVPSGELRTLQAQGKPLPSETSESSNSPVDVGIDIATPVRTFGYSVVFPVVMKIKNIGDGTICSDSYNCKMYSAGGPEWNRLRMEIILPPDLALYGDTCSGEMELYIPRGSEQTVTCQVQAPMPRSLTQKTVAVRAEYGYFVDKTARITVKSAQIAE